MTEELIREEARKAANRSQFMSNYVYDHKSYEDGFYEGMSQALRQSERLCKCQSVDEITEVENWCRHCEKRRRCLAITIK